MLVTRYSLKGKDRTLEKVVSPREWCSTETGIWRRGRKCILGAIQELAGDSQGWLGLVLVTVLLQAGAELQSSRELPSKNTPVFLW